MLWNGTLSLFRDVEGNTGFHTVYADDILYFCIQQNHIMAHTLDGEYYTGWDSLDIVWKALKHSDPRFYRTDRVYIANLSRIKKLNREWCVAYFIDNPTSTSKHCYVARSKLQEVVQRIESYSPDAPFSQR